jgi:hypothetical protein
VVPEDAKPTPSYPAHAGIQHVVASRFNPPSLFKLRRTGRPPPSLRGALATKQSIARQADRWIASLRSQRRGNIRARSRGMICPSFASSLSLSRREGAGNAGCALHPRSRVQSAQTKAHTSIQGSGEHTDIPCAMALRLIPRSPRRRIRLVTVTGGLRSCAPGRTRIASADLAPATGARTTRLHRTLRASFVDRAPESRSRGSSRPAIPSAPDAPRPPHPAAYVK